MAKRFFDSEKFKDKWYRKLSPVQKLIWEYAISECSIAGILNFDVEMMSFFIGAEIKDEDLEIFKDRFIFVSDDLVFIPKFVLFQQKISSLEDLNPQNNAHKSILAELRKYNISPFEPPCGVLVRTPGKGKGKGKGNSNSKGKELKNNYIKVEDLENTEETPREIQKEDPYISPVIDNFSKKYKEVFNQYPPLGKVQREKIFELNRDIPDFKECLTQIFSDLKTLYFKKIKYKPDVIWLLKGSNFLSLKSGEYEKQLEEIRQEQGSGKSSDAELIEKMSTRYANG